MSDIRQSFAHQGLVRVREGRVLGGVCAGLGRRFGIGPWTARLLFVLLLADGHPRQPDPDLPGPVDPDAVGGDGQGPAATGPAGHRGLTLGRRSGGRFAGARPLVVSPGGRADPGGVRPAAPSRASD